MRNRPPVQDSNTGFTAAVATRVAGCTYNQLDYWVRLGLVTPSFSEARGGRGHDRRFSLADIAELKRIVKMIRAGITIAMIRAAELRGVENEIAVEVRRLAA